MDNLDLYFFRMHYGRIPFGICAEVAANVSQKVANDVKFLMDVFINYAIPDMILSGQNAGETPVLGEVLQPKVART